MYCKKQKKKNKIIIILIKLLIKFEVTIAVNFSIKKYDFNYKFLKI
jgi:hypothetical protein